ncbi:MAG TPA: hypothetical protein EYG85_01625 [Crocinitomix sp.]|nr:hypothetical protein [Crocinitomix sp.]
MKNSILVLVVMAVFLWSFRSNEETSYFVQFKVFTVESNEKAQLIDEKMRQKSGVKISRTDYYTSTYYCVLNSGVTYSEEQFKNWFHKLGYEIGCFTMGIHGKDLITSPHTLKSCKNEK